MFQTNHIDTRSTRPLATLPFRPVQSVDPFDEGWEAHFEIDDKQDQTGTK